ncbi:DUF1643 domain-containing protein [Priestia flexa]|uniref:DUF1643 domain-containing protein n=1 Tax=Priestia flexa TaxID=86664 RepID=UPI002E1D7247|nr:DUF1643 domain-containing protein [Priestia flexa]
MKKDAIVDKDLKYRYSLTRVGDEGKEKVTFIMLNPSVADSNVDDATTKRCIIFAQKFGFGSLETVNLFSYIYRL